MRILIADDHGPLGTLTGEAYPPRYEGDSGFAHVSEAIAPALRLVETRETEGLLGQRVRTRVARNVKWGDDAWWWALADAIRRRPTMLGLHIRVAP